MQDKQVTNAHENRPQVLSSQELRFVEEIKKQLQDAHGLSPEMLEQFLALPEKYQKMAIQTVTEQFSTAMKLHVLQLATLFYQRAENEGFLKS